MRGLLAFSLPSDAAEKAGFQGSSLLGERAACLVRKATILASGAASVWSMQSSRARTWSRSVSSVHHRLRSAPVKMPAPCSSAPVTIRSKRPLDAQGGLFEVAFSLSRICGFSKSGDPFWFAQF